MTLMNAFYQLLVSVLLAVPYLTAAMASEAKVDLQIEAQRLTVIKPASDIRSLEVFAKGSAQPLFGQFRDKVFVPTTSFVRGQTYEVVIQFADGSKTKEEVFFGQITQSTPTVSLSPAARKIPANTLKLYLDFNQPMEHGVFLDCIQLKRIKGEEVTGAFRETELWSPDGKRLTLMLHPGRQKTGVNLNLDEGPVLVAKEIYYLTISGRWRSVNGEALGKDTTFGFMATAADHIQPDPAKWQINAPKANTRERLQITTDELFESQILQRALRLDVPGTAQAEVLPSNRVLWTFSPEKPWKPGDYEINIDPELEDLAGNSIAKPFEIDVTAPKPASKTTKLTFRVSPP